MMFNVEVLSSWGVKLADLLIQAPSRKDASDRINDLNFKMIDYNGIAFLLTNEVEL